jgi:AP-1 complex subunit mu
MWCEAAIEFHPGSRIEYMIKVTSQFKRRSTANNVEITIPVPEDADTPKFKVPFSLIIHLVSFTKHSKYSVQ